MSLIFQNISKQFFSPKGEARTVLSNVSFQVGLGKKVFLLGRSGVGKSVLVKQLMGMLQPDTGSILVDGECVCQAHLAAIRKKCGMVFQQPALFDFLSVYENLCFGLEPEEWDFLRFPERESELARRILESLEAVQLEPSILGLFPHDLSYGEQKQVSLARALIPEPQYLICDEPTTGLDPIASRRVYESIARFSKQKGLTSFIVSHDIDFALEFGDEILFLEAGELLIQASPQDFCAFSHPSIQGFLAKSFKEL